MRTIYTLLALGTICFCLTACDDSKSVSKVTPRKVDPNAAKVQGPDAAADSRHKLGSSAVAPPDASKPK
ncbi:MAG: hypothetical protein EXS00_02020 [Phycisphaerales bacterium]|nr:hypothetical protein [Phycisphaerales bacterium]